MDMCAVFQLLEPGTYPFYVSRLFTGFALTARHFWQTPQKGLAVRAKPIFQLNVCNGYVRGTAVKTERTYPFYVSRLFTGFALTARYFWQTPQKYPKGLRPTIRPSSPRLARYPHSGAVVGARRDGPSMARHGWLGVLPRHPQNSPCVRPSVMGIRVVSTIEWRQGHRL